MIPRIACLALLGFIPALVVATATPLLVAGWIGALTILLAQILGGLIACAAHAVWKGRL